MDLYQPTLKALEYFYDRLNPNGVIMLHDYYQLPGIKQALNEFKLSKPQCKIPVYPVGDGSSVFLIKI